MGKHAIIVIKNDNNEYLQYLDNRWNSLLFPNCKLNEDFKSDDILEYISNKLGISKEKIECEYVGEKIHTKFSESAQRNKEYHHYFYNVKIKELPDKMKDKKFCLDEETYTWYSYSELENDTRIQQVNSDIVSFIKEFNM